MVLKSSQGIPPECISQFWKALISRFHAIMIYIDITDIFCTVGIQKKKKWTEIEKERERAYIESFDIFWQFDQNYSVNSVVLKRITRF